MLADGSVLGKGMSSLDNSLLRRCIRTDLENSSPLGEAAAHIVVFFGSLRKAIETHGIIFVRSLDG